MGSGENIKEATEIAQVRGDGGRRRAGAPSLDLGAANFRVLLVRFQAWY